MNIYTGIGTRNIASREKDIIKDIAKQLSELNYICLSGNATGSDITFQNGSENKCVLMLPWKNFNSDHYNPKHALDCYIVGKEEKGLEAVKKFHPGFKYLKSGAKLLLTRNYYQIVGFDKYPKSEFVICCADRDSEGNIKGGTGHTAKIAMHYHVPIINIRDDEWKTQFDELINNLTLFN